MWAVGSALKHVFGRTSLLLMAASDAIKAIGTIICSDTLLPIQFLAELELHTLINYTVRVVMFLNCFWYYFVKFLYVIESLHKTFFYLFV